MNEERNVKDYFEGKSDKKRGKDSSIVQEVRIGEKIEIIKGSMPENVLEGPKEGAKPYLLVSTMTGEEMKYTTDINNPHSKETDTLMIMDGSKSGRVFYGHEGIIGSTMAAIRPHDINPYYLYQFLQKNFERLNSATQGSAVPHTDKDLVKSLKIKEFPLSEQRKIASVLYNVEQAIKKTNKVIEQLKRVKKGVMQDLLSKGLFDHEVEEKRIGTIRCTIPKDWETSNLGSVSTLNPDSFSPESYSETNFEYIALSNISEGRINKSQTIPVKNAPSRARRRIQENDVLIGTVRPRQKNHAIVSSEHSGKVCSTGFGVVRTNDSLCPGYLLQVVLSHRFLRRMESYVAGTGYPAVKLSDLEKIKIPIPPKKEQKEMARILARFDELIFTNNKYHAKLSRIKRGLMQDLLTGKVRTRNKPIKVLERSGRETKFSRSLSGKRDVEVLREVGFSDREIHDVVLITSYFNFVNRMASGLGVEFSPEEVEGYKY